MRKQIIVLLLLTLFVSGCVSTRSARKDNPAPRMAGVMLGRPSCH